MKTKEEDILNSALQSFVTKGFHGSSTASIAEKAGVSNGTLFHYYRSKDVLIQRLHQHIKSEQIVAISSRLEEESDYKEKIKLIWTQSIQWAMTNKEKYIFLNQYKYSPYHKKHKGDVEEFRKHFFEIVEKSIQLKVIRYLPEDFVFDMTNASVYGMVEYLNSNPVKFRTPEFMRQSFDLFFNGIKA